MADYFKMFLIFLFLVVKLIYVIFEWLLVCSVILLVLVLIIGLCIILSIVKMITFIVYFILYNGPTFFFINLKLITFMITFMITFILTLICAVIFLICFMIFSFTKMLCTPLQGAINNRGGFIIGRRRGGRGLGLPPLPVLQP